MWWEARLSQSISRGKYECVQVDTPIPNNMLLLFPSLPSSAAKSPNDLICRIQVPLLLSYSACLPSSKGNIVLPSSGRLDPFSSAEKLRRRGQGIGAFSHSLIFLSRMTKQHFLFFLSPRHGCMPHKSHKDFNL